jgi:hypothetical protein
LEIEGAPEHATLVGWADSYIETRLAGVNVRSHRYGRKHFGLVRQVVDSLPTQNDYRHKQ